MDAIRQVGFIGLGNMGFPMAGRLAAAGFELTLFDTNSRVLKKFTEHHQGRAAASVASLAADVQAVITMLPDGEVVRQVVVGDGQKGTDGLLGAMPAGSILIDMSSSSPSGTRRLGETGGQGDSDGGCTRIRRRFPGGRRDLDYHGRRRSDGTWRLSSAF